MLIVMGVTPQGTEVLYNFKAKTFRLQPAAGGEPVERDDLECLLEECGFTAELIEWNESLEAKAGGEIEAEARRLYDEARTLFREEWVKAQQDADNPDIGPETAVDQFASHLADKWQAYPKGPEADLLLDRLHDLMVDGLS